MNDTASEVLHFVEENDVKFVRLAFTDIFGTMKNISIMADELPRALEDGITFDASAVPGFMNVEESDLFLCPDPGTLAVLPWRPQQGRVRRGRAKRIKKSPRKGCRAGFMLPNRRRMRILFI